MRTALSDLGSLIATGLRGLRSRALLTVGSVLLVVIGVAAAVVGPMYQSASAASFLVAKLRLEPDFLTGVALTYTPAEQVSDAQAKREAAAVIPPAAVSQFTGPELSLWSARSVVARPSSFAKEDAEGVLAALPDCRALVVTGECPQAPGEMLMLKFDARHTGTSVGDEVSVAAAQDPLTVVGTYRLRTRDLGRFDDPSRFTSVLRQAGGSGFTPYRPAPFVVVPSTVTSGPRGSWFVRMDYQLRVDAGTTLSDLEEATAQAAHLRTLLRTDSTSGSLVLERGNELRSVVAETNARRDTAVQTVTPAVLSLIVVALVLLVRLLAAAMDLRRAELALASLRGIARRQLWVLGLLEPVLMLLIAAPLGLVAGFFGARALAAAWLVPGLPLRFGSSSLVFAVGLLAAAFAMAALTVRSSLAEPLSSQIAGVRRPGRAGRWTLVLRLALVAGAVVVLATTLLSGRVSKPTASDLALPILLAAAAGMATGLGTAVAAGWQARRSVSTRGVSRYVASRAIARRREGTWAVLPLTAALAIAVFAAGIYATAASWRASDAATQVGADASYQVDIPLAQALALTHQLDPDGKWLMAAATDADPNGLKVLADTPRLSRVAAWPDSWVPGMTAQQVSAALAPQRSVRLVGRRLLLTVDNSLHGSSRSMLLTLSVSTPEGATRSVIVGPFARGTSTHGAPLPCAGGCSLDRMTIGGPGPFAVRLRGKVAISGATVDGKPLPYFARVGWRNGNTDQQFYGPQAVTGTRVTGSVLTADLDSHGRSTVAVLTPNDVPAAIPALLGRTASYVVTSQSANRVAVATSAQVDVTLRPVATVESMPFYGPGATFVDATMYTRAVPLNPSEGQAYVLARADTPQSVVTGLAEHGITSPVHLVDVRRSLEQDAYALALKLYLVVTVLVLLLAVAGLAVNMAVQVPARRRDAASLRVVGLPRRSIVAAVVVEQTTVLGAAAVAGILAGAMAQYVVVRTLTLGYADTFSPRVLPSLDLPTVTGLLGVALVLLLGVAVFLANLTIRGARTATLRENVA